MMKFQQLLACLLLGVVGTITAPAYAHFLWLTSVEEDGQTKAVLYFSESAHAQDYHLPERMENAEVVQRLNDKRLVTLEMDQVDTEDRVGLVSTLKNKDNSLLATSCDYGIYGGALLSYYTKHVRCADPKDLGAAGRLKKLALEIVPTVIDGRMELSVLWQGKPKSGVDLAVVESNEKSHQLKTDSEGRAYFQPTTSGLVGMYAGFTDRSAKGELDGKAYEGAAHYATLTFHLASIDSFQPAEDMKPVAAEPVASEFPLLPEALASFGAAVHDGWLYVYGGHIGGAHEHSRDNLSQRFQRLNLSDGESWEELPMQTPLQGLALVAHKSGLYRVGGLNAHNAADEAEELHSTAEFARFDPATKQWTPLADLPTARSSHDAVVIGDRLYVAGGWNLEGDSPGTWLDSTLVFDLSNPSGQWQTLPTAPFKRRALATSHREGKLVVIGGLDSEGDISFATNIYDPTTEQWSTGPKLPGQGMGGFGVSAWNLGGELYVSGLASEVHQLNADGQGWTTVAEIKTPRFFHQLLPKDNTTLLAVAGASRTGHLNQVESMSIKKAAEKQ